MKQKIALTGGGTGGHIFPIIALAERLQEKYDITILTDYRGADFIKKSHKNFINNNIKIITLPIKKFNIFFWIKAPYVLMICIYHIFKCNEIISFGGYTTFLPFISAWILRKRRTIYQLDSVVTRLNRILIPFADKVLYIFRATKINHKNAHLTQLPLRKEFKFSFIKHTKHINIGILCGSLDGKYWQKLITELAIILDEKIKKIISIKIQTQNDISNIENFGFKTVEKAGFNEGAELIAQSHLVISRAGAGTISEISAIGRPVYLVPLRSVVEDHQFHNAVNYCDLTGAKFGNDPYELAGFIHCIIDSEEYFYELVQKAVLMR